MPKFIYAFHGGQKPETPEAGAAMMAAWNKWLEGLGPANIDPGAPVGLSKTLSADGVVDNGGSNPLGGYSMVEAKDHDHAVELAKGCPFIAHGGSIEIAEVMPMPS